MTAPEPHSSPTSRRAARLQRERDEQRALGGPDAEPAALLATPDAAREPLTVTAPLPVIAAPETRRSRATRAPAASGPTPIRVGARRASAAPTRRAQKIDQLMNPPASPPRHARPQRILRAGVVAGAAVIASLVLGSAASMTAALTGEPPLGHVTATTASSSEAVDPEPSTPPAAPLPAPVESIPAPTVAAAPAAVELCAQPAFTDALAAGDDAAVIAAAGGAETFRTAVAGGGAPCVALDDPARVWVVVNKLRPAAPSDYWPAALAEPADVRSTAAGTLRTDAAAALTAMAAAAAEAGVGDIGLESGFRSFTTQQSTYAGHVAAQGATAADLSSARPGFSEHQTGLAGDVVPCSGGCGTLDDLATTSQGEWIVAHAWEFGWITRYEAGYTPVTGYDPEPWHLRYIGPDLARAYHDGGWHTLEEFFGLPPAPGYAE